MKKIGQFFKKYGFYVAISVICIGALTAIFVLPGEDGNVQNEPNPYAKNEQTDGLVEEGLPDSVIIDEEDALDTTDEMTNDEPQVSESQVPDSNVEEDVAASEEEANNSQVAEEEVQTETFESTTASVANEPFFAEGDTFSWPVVGEVVVPYTDETTRHWFSESLNQTMRTFGICIGADENTEVKAVAKGTVVDIVEDSSSLLEAGMPYVGKTVVLDLGNGYVCLYGFQGGTVNEALLGQVVNEGDVLGTIGSPKGAFINEGDNIYVQVMHNDNVVNPMDFLEDANTASLKAEGVDLGFAEN